MGSVIKWEDPFDSAVYCLQTDGQAAMLTGTARHGLVRLWDKRQQEHVQVSFLSSRGGRPRYQQGRYTLAAVEEGDLDSSREWRCWQQQGRETLAAAGEGDLDSSRGGRPRQKQGRET